MCPFSEATCEETTLHGFIESNKDIPSLISLNKSCYLYYLIVVRISLDIFGLSCFLLGSIGGVRQRTILKKVHKRSGDLLQSVLLLVLYALDISR